MPARARRYELLEDFWRQFHRAWGHNASGLYDKRGWDDLRQTAENLHAMGGLERRRMARAELRRVSHD